MNKFTETIDYAYIQQPSHRWNRCFPDCHRRGYRRLRFRHARTNSNPASGDSHQCAHCSTHSHSRSHRHSCHTGNRPTGSQ